MIRAAWESVAVYALAPMQDFLNLDNRARMNYPGNPSGNWTWRMADSAMDESLQAAIREINFLYDRENLPLENKEEEPDK
jgi:4-alpha-glucanotransferase